MSSLSDYPLEFIDDRPFQIPKRVGRISNKMSKSTNTPEAPKVPKAKYSKTRGEHIKDVVIAMLVTGIIAFVGGVWFNEGKQQEIETAVKGAQTVATPEVKK
jgi:hypothetical protein